MVIGEVSEDEKLETVTYPVRTMSSRPEKDIIKVCVTEARFRHLGEERTFDTPSRSPKAKGGRRMSYGGT
ncbi:unnamed protein product [Brassica rapa]|uniref:Uncharacterized protein n=1 Tax=Brassica campestris TaxID=3711 RepID=A0A8D9CR64_BRACM|nr:unnamed protein product [Brassica rapa]